MSGRHGNAAFLDPYAFVGPRQLGESWSARHIRMVDALPEEGGTIIVITNEIGRHLIRGIRAVRGFAIRQRWRFIAVRTWDDCALLEGMRGQVIVDWTFATFAKPAVQQRARELIDGVMSMHVG